MNIFKKIYNFYKHAVNLYDTKPVTRKEYLIVLLLFALINLLSYAGQIKFVSALAGLFLLFFTPLLLIITFNRLKNTIISSIPAFILSFFIPYLILVLNVSTDDLKMNIPLEKYYNIIFLIYFALLFLSGLILPVSNKEITYKNIDKDNKKLNLLHLFNDLITLNFKTSINRAEYIVSCILAFILPICMFVLSYLLVILLRIFYRSNLNAANKLSGDGPFVLDFFSPELIIFISFAVCVAVTIILFFLLFILRLNDITKNLYVKFSIITAYIILLAAGIIAAGINILLNKNNLPGMLIYAIPLFIIPAFIKGKSVNKYKINILEPIYNFYKHLVDLYNTKPVTRKEYLILILLFSLITLLSYALLDDDFLMFVIFFILVLFVPLPLLLIVTFNRLKNTIISSIPAFILSFIIPYLLIIINVSTTDLKTNIPPEKYYNIQFLYFALLFLAGLILPVSKNNKEITNKDNKRINLIKIFNYIITLNFKASINRVEYIISCIFAVIVPIFTVFISYQLITLLRFFYSYYLEYSNTNSDTFTSIMNNYFLFVPVTIFLLFLLFILRLNDITKNLILKFSIITAYIILITAGIVVIFITPVMETLMPVYIVLIPVFTILLFIVPAFINGKSVKENII